MKRTQLIEWGIVVTGLIFGFKFLEGLFSLVLELLYGFEGLYNELAKVVIPLLLSTGLYAGIFILLIRNSGRIAQYLNGKAVNDIIPVKIGKQPLLQVILIAICVGSILSHIADIFLYIFEIFKREAGGRNFEDPDKTMVTKYRFSVAALQSIIAVVVLYFSRPISSWFIRSDEVDNLSFDSTPEN